jgi:outer membrane protein OmpA-like peptidoglycan-associated protein
MTSTMVRKKGRVVPSARVVGRGLPLLLLLVAACATPGPVPPSLPLRQVVLYRNGLGYFEHTGSLASNRLRMRLRAGEVDDVMKTLAVLSRDDNASIGAVASLKKVNDEGDLDLDLSVPTDHEITVSYASPTPVWRATYKLVLGEGDSGLLQTWAVVNNDSDQDWRDVRLTLATGAPFSYAVDLHTSQRVQRPDATGRLVAPPITGLVAPERGEPDRDHDRIPDSRDACPDEPETYNGYQDQDGCPDRGTVLLHKGSLQILDRVYFAAGSHTLKPEAGRLLDAIAATLKGNPEVTLTGVEGYAANDEPDPMEVAKARATAVRRALIERGVSADRLLVRGFGAARPHCTASNEDCRSTNRRVEFSILDRGAPAEQMVAQRTSEAMASTPATVANAERGLTPAPTRAQEVAGMMRYEIGIPVTIPGRSSAMVAIESRRLAGAEVYLYRPDPSAPGSDAHPYRAARFECPPGYVLEGGPLAIYARGTFVGDAILDRLQPGQVSLVPFALDGGTSVRVTQDSDRQPVRLIRIARGVFTVEDRRTLRTRYQVAAAESQRARVYVRYEPREGYEITSLPPGSEQESDAVLVPVDLAPDGRASLTLEASRPEQREVNLVRGDNLELGPYLAGSTDLPAAVAERLRRLEALRAEAEHLDVAQELLRRQTDDSAQRLAELRANLEAIEKNPAAGPLRKQLNDELAKAVRANEELSQKTAAQVAARDEKRAKLRTELEDLSYDRPL